MAQTMQPPADSLAVKHIHKNFSGIRVLKGVSFSVSPGSITALVGSNGAGKSTLINIMAGVFHADQGQVYVHGLDVTAKSMHERVAAGFMRTFQHPRVFHSFSVARGIQLASTGPREETLFLSICRALGISSPPDKGSLSELDVPALSSILGKWDSNAASLSYGEQKLLMLAQVLATKASVLLFDELCAGLEPALVDKVRNCIRQLSQEGKTIVFVEHNLALVRELADRVVFLHQGEIFREGPTDEVLKDPQVIELYLGH